MSDVEESVLAARQADEKVKSRVRELCADFPSVRGDYRLLWWRYIQRFHGAKLSFPRSEQSFFVELRSMPSPETIGRRYRELAEAGEEVQPLPGTQLKRGKRARVMREFYSQRELWDFEVL